MVQLDSIAKARLRLRKVDIERTLEDGRVITERRANDGTFVDVPESSSSPNNDDTVPADGSTVSRRRQKKVEHARRAGYVIDLKPDLQLAHIINGLYLGSQDVAADFSLLKGAGITHIVNCATRVKCLFPKNFVYLELDLRDDPTVQIVGCFPAALSFIHEAISSGNRVFVHCNAGISRAATICLAYLMTFENQSLERALTTIKRVRPGIRPNQGFMLQLLQYEMDLRSEKESTLQESSFSIFSPTVIVSSLATLTLLYLVIHRLS